jgi:N-dimethylarginine dimethylaminohydrolase
VEPHGVLMCPPDHFAVVDVKNPFMAGREGTVDADRARAQWEELSAAFRDAGLGVETLDPLPGLEDMVFAANQTFPGLGPKGERICLLSRMRHASRRKEVPAYARWFQAHGYDVRDAVPEGVLFEGCGDAFWHPGRRSIWAGFGFRSDRTAHDVLAETFEAEVFSLRLVDERFYHLDTCLCPLDEKTALLFGGAFDAAGREKIGESFAELLGVDEEEAVGAMACNATAFRSTVVIDRRAARTIGRLRERGYRVLPVDTGEFMKSGGSVFCLKQFLY